MLSAAAVTTHLDLVVSIPKANGGTELRSVLGEDVEESSSGAVEGSDSGSGESRKLWEKWRSFLVVCLLILVVSFDAAAYSLVGPFLPIAVGSYYFDKGYYNIFLCFRQQKKVVVLSLLGLSLEPLHSL